MKRTLIIALLVAATSGPVLAGGFYRTSPESKQSKQSKQSCKHCSEDCKIKQGLTWLIKLPFRLVAATGYGLYGIVADQDLNGFEEGYDKI